MLALVPEAQGITDAPALRAGWAHSHAHVASTTVSPRRTTSPHSSWAMCVSRACCMRRSNGDGGSCSAQGDSSCALEAL